MSLPADITAIITGIRNWVIASSGLPTDQVVWGHQGGGRRPSPWISMVLTYIRSFGIDWEDREDNILSFSAQPVVSVTPASDSLEITAHPFVTGDGPVQLTTTGTLPSGLQLLTDYFVIVVDTDNIQLADTYQRSLVPTVLPIADAGTGVHTVSATTKTVRGGEELIYHRRGPREVGLVMQCFGGDAVGAASSLMILNAVRSRARMPSVKDVLSEAGVGIFGFGDVADISGVINGSLFEPRARLEVRLSMMSEVTETGTFIEFVNLTNTNTSETFWVPNDPT